LKKGGGKKRGKRGFLAGSTTPSYDVRKKGDKKEKRKRKRKRSLMGNGLIGGKRKRKGQTRTCSEKVDSHYFIAFLLAKYTDKGRKKKKMGQTKKL